MDKVIEKKIWWKRRGLLAAISVILVLVIGAVLLMSTAVSTLNVSRDKISMDTVRRSDFLEFIPIDGVVQPLRTIYLDAIEGGRVVEKYVEEGNMVKTGDPLLRLANNELQLDFMTRETSLLDQLNNMRNTKISLEQNHLQMKQQLLDVDRSFLDSKKNYERSKQLMIDKVLAKAEFEKIEDDFEYLSKKRKLLMETIKRDSSFKVIQSKQLESSSELIQRNLDLVKVSLDNLIIRAPISGRLNALNAEFGENKQRGENIGQIDVMEGFKVVAGIDEHYISGVRTGLHGEFLFDGKVYLLEIKKVLPQVVNGQFKVELIFVNEVPNGIKQGQTVQIRLALSNSKKALLLQRGGFYQQSGGTWVYVLDGNKARRRDIRLGKQNPDYYEVLEGLVEGEAVIISSYDIFGDASELIVE